MFSWKSADITNPVSYLTVASFEDSAYVTNDIILFTQGNVVSALEVKGQALLW